MSVQTGNLDFSSLYRYEHIALKGSKAFSLASGVTTQTTTIPHNLGYSPVFKLFYSFGDGKYFEMFAGALSYNIDGKAGQINNFFADTTNLYVDIGNYGAGTLTGTIYYRIYEEPS